MGWNIVSALVAAISVGILIWQLRTSQRTTHAQVYATTITWLQNEDVRMARRKLFSLIEKKIEDWNEEETLEAEKVCHTYDTVATMVRYKLLPKKIIEECSRSLKQSWKAASPLIMQYRKDRSDPYLWHNFELLVQELDLKSGSA